MPPRDILPGHKVLQRALLAAGFEVGADVLHAIRQEDHPHAEASCGARPCDGVRSIPPLLTRIWNDGDVLYAVVLQLFGMSELPLAESADAGGRGHRAAERAPQALDACLALHHDDRLPVQPGGAPSTLSKRYSRGSTPCIEPCEPHPIEKAKQRRGGRAGRYSLAELATDIWTLAGIDGEPTVVEWVSERPESEAWIRIPSERPAVLWENPLFPDSTVYFGQSRRERVNCGTTEQARLVRRLAELGVVGDVKVPDGGGAEILREEVDARVGVAKERFEGLAEARTSNTRQREQLVEMLVLWYVRGQT